jgi:hypothetical protein
VAAVLSTCALLGLVGGCTGPTGPGGADPSSLGWAAPAVAYIAAFDAAWSEGITNAARFYAADVTVDQRGLCAFVGTGRAGLAQTTRDLAQEVPRWLEGTNTADVLRLTPTEPVYLSATGAIHPHDSVIADGYAIPMAPTYTIGAGGITEEVFAGSAKSGQELASVPMENSEPIVRAYVGAWASGDTQAVRARYADDAELVDTLDDLTASGAEAIAALARRGTAQGGLGGASLRSLPGDEGPAWYVNTRCGQATADMLVLLLDLPGECPGPVAVQLRLDQDGRIVREERFHRVDALARCRSGDDAPRGWWDSVTLPKTPAVPRTGTVRIGTQDIAVWNGTGRHDGLLRWALQRFAEAGLPARLPSSVTLLPDVPEPWEAYGFVTGSNAADIGVPATAVDPCSEPSCTWSAAAKHAILHELAHLWLTPCPYYGPPDRSAARRALRRWAEGQRLAWDDQALPWEQRAGELAAEILAWGLMDQPDTIDARLGDPSCAALDQDFQALTSTTADPRACPEGSPP